MSVGERVSADPACRRVLDQLVALVRVWTPAEGVVYVNRAWRDLTGTTLEDNLGDGWLRRGPCGGPRGRAARLRRGARRRRARTIA